jgi:predicted nucleotidyltransferase component of viral defense system
MKEYLRQLIKEQPNILLKRNVVREYLQVRILQSLQDEGAFLNMAFLGGTSLRFLFFLPRYSEDLDFSILSSKDIFFENLLNNIKRDLEAENYTIDIKANNLKPVIYAFIKFPFLLFELGLSAHREEVLSIKIKIDINPPKGEGLTTTIIRRYIVLNILHYDKASLFAGKIHAILTRKYTKGRDMFDFVWMLSDPSWPLPNFIMLNNALNQTKWKGLEVNYDNWRKILIDHVTKIDWKRAVDDVAPFLERENDRDLLNAENCKRLIGEFKPASI